MRWPARDAAATYISMPFQISPMTEERRLGLELIAGSPTPSGCTKDAVRRQKSGRPPLISPPVHFSQKGSSRVDEFVERKGGKTGNGNKPNESWASRGLMTGEIVVKSIPLDRDRRVE